MKRVGMDLSVKKNADITKNQTAMTGIFIMNLVLALAYVIEVLKGARTIGSYAIVAVLCIVPCVLSTAIYLRNKAAFAIRYVMGIGFSFLYGYILFSSSNDLPFCYVIVAFVMLVVYVDRKLLVILGTYAFVVNVIRIALLAMKGQLVGTTLTNAEIILACIVLTFVFMLMAISKISQINQANIDKADQGKLQSEALLETTLNVASSLTENINDAMGETEVLKDAIDTTQHDMETWQMK